MKNIKFFLNERLRSVIYIAILLLLILLSFVFSITYGLVYGKDKAGNLLFTNDLLSSGSNDNLCIQIGVIIFLVPLIFKLARFKKKIQISDCIVFFILWLLQFFFLITIEAGSIIKTILYSYNFALLIWIIIFLVSFAFNFFNLFVLIKNRS